MSILQLLYYPDKRLRKVAQPVIKFGNDIQHIINNMFDIMYAKQGIGLAATQVNIHQQIVVVNLSHNVNQQLVLINPKILEKSGEISINEGCLSIPKQQSFIKRSKKIRISALDQNGDNFEMDAINLLAVCIQHEIDHLIGKLFIDYLSSSERQHINQKIEKTISYKINNV